MSVRRPAIKLALSENGSEPAKVAPWIGPLAALGGMAHRYAATLSGRQLVVAVSVPRRDFAAALLACGWIVASTPPALQSPLDTLRSLEQRAPVRLVTRDFVITDYFMRLDERTEPRVVLRWQSDWLVSRVDAVAKLPGLDAPARSARPRALRLGPWAQLEVNWENRLALPPAPLAIVGTLKWLEEDFSAFLAMEPLPAGSEPAQPPPEAGKIADILQPQDTGAATWFTRTYASSRLPEQLPLPGRIQGAILDGAGAIKYLTEMETPVTVCIIDRSIADETAAEIVVQIRNSRGEPVSLRDNIGWRPPPGVEALAFTVTL